MCACAHLRGLLLRYGFRVFSAVRLYGDVMMVYAPEKHQGRSTRSALHRLQYVTHDDQALPCTPRRGTKWPQCDP